MLMPGLIFPITVSGSTTADCQLFKDTLAIFPSLPVVLIGLEMIGSALYQFYRCPVSGVRTVSAPKVTRWNGGEFNVHRTPNHALALLKE
jgi:hypothetical protein